MQRVIIKLKDGTYINTIGDYLSREEGYLTAWNGNDLIAVVLLELVTVAYLSEKGTGKQTNEGKT